MSDASFTVLDEMPIREDGRALRASLASERFTYSERPANTGKGWEQSGKLTISIRTAVTGEPFAFTGCILSYNQKNECRARFFFEALDFEQLARIVRQNGFNPDAAVW